METCRSSCPGRCADRRRCHYCTSLSKTLSPGLRIGWLLAGEKHLERVRRLKLSGTITSPAVNQLVAASFLETGAYDRHLRKLRGALKAQLRSMRACLAEHLPAGSSVSAPGGGFLLWTRFAEALDAHALYSDAQRKQISVLPGTLCAIDGKYNNCIRLNAGNPYDASIEGALITLSKMVLSRVG